MTAARMTFWLPDVSEAKKNIMLFFVSGKKVNLDRQQPVTHFQSSALKKWLENERKFL